MYKPDIVITHYPCSDGATSEAVIRKFYNDDSIEYIKGDYGDAKRAGFIDELIDKVRGKHVLIADFSYKAKEIQGLITSAESIVILDHHITAQSELENFKLESFHTVNEIEELLKEQKCIAIFDMDECGSSLTWQFFYPDTSIPPFVERIKDIDLGRHNMPRSPDFLWFTRAIPINGASYIPFLDIPTEDDLTPFLDKGVVIRQYVETTADRIIENAIEGEYEGFTFKYVTTDYAFCSEISSRFVKEGFDLGITGYFTKSSFGLSIRSREGVDCSILAKAWGGGGHKQASGVNIPFEEAAEFLEAMNNGIIWK